MAKPKNPHGDGGDGGTTGKPPQKHGNIDAGKGISSAQQATAQAAQNGRPGGSGGKQPGKSTNPPPNKPAPPPKPTAPPKPDDIHHSDASEKHIIEGDGGRQGGHLAGTGFSKKTEFPQGWDKPKILDAAHEVTQQGPPKTGPKPTEDADGNPAWAYTYEGTVDGVTVRTIVLSNGEIRTAFPPNGADPGVITNPSAPNPQPKGVPVSEPPRYSHPDVGGDGSWTWEGPKGNKIVRVVQDAEGNVTRTELGDYQKKK
ncbi:EndoU domain-containing protein [Saccharopolyspora sp. 5N102]|uniref:EndoU domain-containing protein n=1 Tax=Saccharopolyspora sp. 5N102 TaxID=3375155 RepID=UPI0037930BB7